MYRILTCSRDTYICDKIIANSFRAVDANVGQAGTLDLFKLYDESEISGSDAPNEISRLLVKFDLNPLRGMTGSILDLSSPSFRCFMHLTDVYGGQTVPTNFKVLVLPLSRAFDEGFGRDIVQFQDLDSANFLTASSALSAIDVWAVSGANSLGVLNTAGIDAITSGNLGAGVVSLSGEQLFETGEEDLFVDVTTVISGVLTGRIPDHGFRISFSGSQETDDKTRFVKRFASRHSTNTRIRPRLRVVFDDSIRDDHENFFFDLSGSLFLNNFHRGTPANILSGSALTPVTGPNSLLLTLTSGSLSMSFTGSQHSIGGNLQAGVYSASFAISSVLTALTGEIRTAGSATFSEVWSSLDRTVPFLSSTLVIRSIGREAFQTALAQVNFSVPNAQASYKQSTKTRFRVFAQSTDINDFESSKEPLVAPSEIFHDLHYRVRDTNSGDIIIPFDTQFNSTRLSTDSSGMYFDLYMDSLDVGRVYEIELLLNDRGTAQVFTDLGARFRVDV